MARLVQIYKEVSNIIEKVNNKQGSIQKFAGNNSTVYALAHEVHKFQDILSQIIKDSRILKENPTFNKLEGLMRVAVYDLLMGKKDAQKVLKDFESIHHPMFPLVKKYYSDLNSAFVMIKIEKKVSKNSDLLPESSSKIEVPRYIRVNTVLGTLKGVETEFLLRGWKKVDAFDKIDEKSYMIDSHIPNLLILSNKIKLHDDDLLKSGKIVIQDKASCLPSYLMYVTMKENGCIGECIDACAAPGNKTSHIADLTKKPVYAFDKDAERLETLIALCKKCKLNNVQSFNQDFLTVDPKKYPNVTGIILDPSCSGSGIPNREQIPEEDLPKRLSGLSGIQKRVIRHAMTFDSVQVITYSTCSIHDEENELVVKEIQDSQNDFILVKNVFPEWKTRGNSKYPDIGPHVIRAYPETDLTRNGFFVAVFIRNKKRKRDAKSNPRKK